MKKRITVVSNTYNEADNVEEFFARTKKVMEELPRYDWEILIIDNASSDGTPDLLRKLAASEPRLKVILNARNFGHIRSPYHASLQAEGDCIVTLVSDLQNPPELIPTLVEKWEEGYKAVVCVKNASEESTLFFFIRRCYYKLVHRLSDTEIIENFTGFGLYDRTIVEYCRKLNDPYPYFRGIISEIGLPTARIPFTQPQRKRGFTKNNLYTLYDMAMLGITNHSKVPLRLATITGFCIAILSSVVGLVYLIYKLMYWYEYSAGIAPLVIGLFFFGAVQLFFIGILGEYIGAIHTHILNRPLVVEKERINF